MSRKKICLLGGTLITIDQHHGPVAVPVGLRGTVLKSNNSDMKIGDMIFIPWTAIKFVIDEED